MTKMEGTHIGKREFEQFKAECELWRKKLGLMDWRIFYQFEEVDNALAAINRDFEGKVARISLNPFQGRCTKREVDVRQSARHEMFHLLLAELEWLQGRRVVSENIWSAAEHAVIRRLESAFSV